MTEGSSTSYCADQVRRHDYDRYLCALFAPRERRWALFALYAFNFEVAKVRETVSEPILGRIRYQWWREAIEGIFEGRPRRHEVVQPLAQAVVRFGLSRELFDGLIDAREFDLSDEPPTDIEALARYAEATSANLQLLTLEALGADGGAAEAAARHAGIAWALTGLLRAVPFHAAAGRLYLPRDLSAQVGLDREELFRGRSSPALARVVTAVAEAAQAHIASARERRREVARKALAAMLPVALAEAYLARMRKAGFDVFDPGLVIAPLSRQLRLALYAALGRY